MFVKTILCFVWCTLMGFSHVTYSHKLTETAHQPNAHQSISHKRYHDLQYYDRYPTLYEAGKNEILDLYRKHNDKIKKDARKLGKQGNEILDTYRKHDDYKEHDNYKHDDYKRNDHRYDDYNHHENNEHGGTHYDGHDQRPREDRHRQDRGHNRDKYEDDYGYKPKPTYSDYRNGEEYFPNKLDDYAFDRKYNDYKTGDKHYEHNSVDSNSGRNFNDYRKDERGYDNSKTDNNIDRKQSLITPYNDNKHYDNGGHNNKKHYDENVHGASYDAITPRDPYPLLHDNRYPTTSPPPPPPQPSGYQGIRYNGQFPNPYRSFPYTHEGFPYNYYGFPYDSLAAMLAYRENPPPKEDKHIYEYEPEKYICPSDGMYYRDSRSFYQCHDSKFNVQFCAPGTLNVAKIHYDVNRPYTEEYFCTFNMVSLGHPGAVLLDSRARHQSNHHGRKHDDYDGHSKPHDDYGTDEKKPAH